NTEIGQGTITAFAQLVAETLGVTPERIDVHEAATARVADSGPTVASRTVMIVGGLLARCAEGMRATLETVAGGRIAGDDEFRRVARAYHARHGPLLVERRYERP